MRPMKELLRSSLAGKEASVVLLETAEEQEGLIKLFEEIANDEGWKPSDQLRAYPKSSVYFGLVIEDRLIGGLQLVIGNNTEGLPCLTVWPELGLQGYTDVADIALLALAKEYRGPGHFWMLCVEMWRYCQTHAIQHLWVEVTPRNLRAYKWLGWPLEIQGELKLHWDEDCHPCSMSVSDVYNSIAIKSITSEFYKSVLAIANRIEPRLLTGS